MKKIGKLTRISRGRKMNPQEAAEAKRARDLAEQDAPLVLARRRASKALEALAKQAKQARLDQQLTLQQVSEKSGIDISNLAKIENGQRENPTIDTLFRIAAALGRGIEIKLVAK
jgi:hypothetical protein